jgi:tetratricopeptide (TPR) repeat protein
VIVVAVAAAYSNSFSGPFIFDDVASVQMNRTIRSLRSAEVLIPPGKTTVARRPLANLSFAVSFAIGKLAVRSYHVGNLLIHLLAALTLFGVVRRTLLLPALRDRFGGASTGLAAAAALIWALHPLQTESVTYIVQRVESLMGLCYLLTLYAVIRGASSERPWPWYAVAIVVCALGMGAKEVMVTAPLVALLYDRAFLSGSFRDTFRRRGALYLGLAATWAVLGAMMLLGNAPGGAGFGLDVGPWEYARTQPGVILHYLRLSFWPSPLCFDYSWPIAASAWQDLPAAAAIAALLAASLWALWRAPVLGFFGAWFFLVLAPSSSFLPIASEVAAEHRMYLPLAAPAAAAVVAAWLAAERLPRRRLALGIAALLALCAAAGLGAMTFQRNAQYSSEISIWEDTVRKRPENARAWSALGRAYDNASRYDEAIQACDKAIGLDPGSNLFDGATAYCNRGVAYAGIGRLAEAVQDYDKAIAFNPDYALAYNNRGLASATIGRLTEAIADYDKAIALNPDYVEAYESRGIAYARSGRADDALRDFDQALRLEPDYGLGYYNRGLACAQIGRLTEAIGDYDKAIAFNPDYAEMYESRGVAYARSARPAEALRDFDKAVELKPHDAQAHNVRGIGLARAGRFDEAIRDYDEAIQLSPDFAAAYNNRAIAYCAIKAYDKARADVETFLRLGGRPDPGFLKALDQATGTAK